MSASRTLDTLLAALWTGYKARVSYAAQYQMLVERQGGQMRNDHIAFRTFNCKTGHQPPGVDAIARIFEPLGYRRKDQYLFEDKHLTAWHWEHATNDRYPKLFISQLEVERLPDAAAGYIRASVKDALDGVIASDLETLKELSHGRNVDDGIADALAVRLAIFFGRPWTAPRRMIVETVNKDSQYAAWVLLHGNAVNHFTAYINEQNAKAWPDIEATVAALRDAGIPMKPDFEGERGSKLRQSSTQAVDEECEVVEDGGAAGKLKWSYAYYELAERGMVTGADGKQQRFQGFLGAQATNLFDMTKRG